MEKVFIHMRKSTIIMATCLLIICFVPFLTQVSAFKTSIGTGNIKVTHGNYQMTSAAKFNIVDLSDNYLYYEFNAFVNETAANVTFFIISESLYMKNILNFTLLPDSNYLTKSSNITTLSDRVKIPDAQNWWLIFVNNNAFDLNVTYSLGKEEIGTKAIIGGSIISGIGVLGFIIVLIFRKRPQSPQVPMETSQ